MGLQTDLSVKPYYDDYDPNSKYYKVLFKPGVGIQTRELNQLQSIFQNQLERFGDNVFTRGTIIEGCDVTFHSIFPYVKIKDNETDGTPVNVGAYEGFYLIDQNKLTASIPSVQVEI